MLSRHGRAYLAEGMYVSRLRVSHCLNLSRKCVAHINLVVGDASATLQIRGDIGGRLGKQFVAKVMVAHCVLHFKC